MQDVRSSAAALRAADERVALLHAEAVLLVDDQQRELGEADILLQERVGADGDARLAGGDAGQRFAAFLGGQGSRDELGGRQSADEPGRGLRVLRGERLRRRQEHALETGLRGAHQAVESDDRLARAHVALQQPPHRRLPAQVRVELVQRLELVSREREGQCVEKGAAELSGRRQRRRLEAKLLLLLVQQQPHLHQEQLLEHQALAGQLRLRERARQVHGRDRVAAAGQALAHEQPGR